MDIYSGYYGGSRRHTETPFYQYQSLLGIVPEPACIVDGEGGLLYANRELCALFRLELPTGPEETVVSGDLLKSTILRIEREHTRQPLSIPALLGDAAPLERVTAEGCVVVVPTAGRVPVNVSAARLDDARYALILRDLRDARRVSEALAGEERRASAENRLRGIGHDLNNALTALRLESELLEAERHLGEDGQRRLSRLFDALQDAANIGNELAWPSREEVTEHRRGLWELYELVRYAARSAVRGRTVRCEITSSAPTAYTMIPATSLVQLVRALVTNAADSMVEGGVVRLTLSAVTAPGADNRRRSLPIADSSQEFFRLSVEDSGEGIAESDRPRLFEPYYSTKHGAAGLGLTVTRQTLAEYGGGLDVASTVGEGTVVSAYIPVYGIGHRRAQRAHTSGDAARFRVLVMDDDERVRSSVREMLQRIGYRVTLSADGHEAIYLYEKALEAGAPFDLCIFDSIVAGGLSGPEAMARIHQSHPEASGVLMCAAQTEIAATSMPAYHLSESGDESPFLAVLYKPFGYHAVAETVSHALAQRSL